MLMMSAVVILELFAGGSLGIQIALVGCPVKVKYIRSGRVRDKKALQPYTRQGSFVRPPAIQERDGSILTRESEISDGVRERRY